MTAFPSAGCPSSIPSAASDPIVIVGIAVEAPGGIETPEELFRALAAQEDLTGPLPRDRDWPVDQVLALGELDGWGHVADAGGFLDGAAEFDPQFFGLSPREAVSMDPQQRVALRVGWRALENTGIDPASVAGTEVGVYFGASIAEYGPRAAAVNEYSGHRIAGTALGAVSGRLSHALGAAGPSMTVDTACASSLNAVHLAAAAIRDGECDTAVAGGVCVMGSPAAFVEFARNNALASDGRCHTYAASADGTSWGEGAGAVVLERESRALALGHRIYGTVLGSRINHNGGGGPIVIPSAKAQRAVIEKTLAVADVDPAEVGYIEGHGTATLGDKLELTALAQTYGAARAGGEPVPVGSIKANGAHAQAAAGILGLVKVLMCGRHGVIVGSRFADDPTPVIDWETSGLVLDGTNRPWPWRDGRRVAAVSSFGVSGTNAHLIVAMPVPAERPADPAAPLAGPVARSASPAPAGYRLPDGRTPVVVSADDPELLREQARLIAAWVRRNPQVGIPAIGSYLLRARPLRRYRAVVTATEGDAEGLLGALDALVAGVPHRDVVGGREPTARRAVAYVYPGQGSQRVGMGALEYRCSRHYRAAVDEVHAEALRVFGESPRGYLLGEYGDDDPAARDVRVIQPAIFMHMVGLSAMWDAAGVTPALTVGHSQGEIAAAVRSGTMSLHDGLVIVTVRARLVHELSPRGYTMAVVGVDIDECEALLARNSGWAELSVVNSRHLLCISGERSMVLGVIDELTAAGKFAREIRVEYPAHTSVVSRFQPEFVAALAGLLDDERLAEAAVPCLGATLGGPIEPGMALGDYWFWNLRNRVRFDKAVDRAVDLGADVFVELSEHPTLALALAETLSYRDADTAVLPTRRRDCTDLTMFSQTVAKLAASDTGFRFEALAVEAPATETRVTETLGAGIPGVGSPGAGASGVGGPGVGGPGVLEDFPNTVMRRTRLWAQRESGSADPVNAPGWAAGASAPSYAASHPEVLHVRWRRLTQRSLTAPRTVALLDPTGTQPELAAQIAAAAGRHGARVTLPGHPWDPDTDTALLLVPDDSANPAGLLAEGRWRGGVPDLPRHFCWVTVGGEQVEGDGPPAPGAASISAALRCAAPEHPGTAFAHIDLGAGTGSGDDVLSALHVAGEPELAVRSGALFAKRLVPAGVRVAGGSDEGGCDAGGCDAGGVDSGGSGTGGYDTGHVLITGGTGRVGMEFCRALAASGARRITLVSRTGGDGATAVLVDRLRRRHGTLIDVIAADLTDGEAVTALAAGLASPVTLLIHAALDYRERLLSEVTADDVAAAAGAKADGLHRLLGALGTAPGAVLLASSLAATLGGRGQALYALGNRGLEVAAAELRDRGITAGALAWGLWQVQGPLDGAGVAAVTATGVIPMAPRAAVPVSLGLVGADAVVMSADWAALRDLLSLGGAPSLLDEVPDSPSWSAARAADVAGESMRGAAPPAGDAGPAVEVAGTAVEVTDRSADSSNRPAVPEAAGERSAIAPPVAPTGLPDDFAALMTAELAHTLGLVPQDIDVELPLVALGLDSLQALDFRKKIQSTMGCDLPVEAILGGATLAEVVDLMTA